MNPLTEDGSRGDEERGRARGRTKRERKSEFRPTSAPLQLSEEEKAVLMDCRRNSIARGIILQLTHYWFHCSPDRSGGHC